MNAQDFFEELFRLARQRFEEYEVYAVKGESFFAKVTAQKCEKYTVQNTAGVSFRAKKNGRIGYASSTVFSEESAAALVENAAKNLEILESKDEQFIFEGSAHYPSANSYSEELARTTPQQRIALAMELERQALAASDAVIRTEGSAVGYGESEVMIRNSKGLSLQNHCNYLYAYVLPIAEKDGVMNNGFAYAFGRSLSDIDTTALAAEAVKDAAAQLGAASCASGTFPIVLRSDTVADLLDTFSDIFSAECAQRGLSLLKGREGEMVASSCVTITDDPLCPDAPIRSAFDDEGVAAQTKNVIENGVLRTLLYDLKTAAKAGVTSTGNGNKASYTSDIHVAPSNFSLKPGSISFEELLCRAENGILITELNGLHSGANAATGDFSLSAKGYMIENGKRSRAVAGITVSGNFYTLLKSILCVGSDFRWGLPGDGTYGAPSILVSGLSVAGSE